jgi:hypothetical protein
LSVTFTATEENGKKFQHLRIVINSNALKCGTAHTCLISCYLFSYSFTTALKFRDSELKLSLLRSKQRNVVYFGKFNKWSKTSFA